MRAGEQRRSLLLAAAMLCAGRARAIDNPDAPDWVAEFEARCRPIEQRVADATDAAAESAAQREFASFLEHELNEAFHRLSNRLEFKQRVALQKSQRRWLDFRDAESRFIDDNWVPQRFGSWSALSRAGYRASLVKQRVLTLLAYLKNYPPER